MNSRERKELSRFLEPDLPPFVSAGGATEVLLEANLLRLAEQMTASS